MNLLGQHEINGLLIQFRLRLSLLVSGQILEGDLTTDAEYMSETEKRLSVEAALQKERISSEPTLSRARHIFHPRIAKLQEGLVEGDKEYLCLEKVSINGQHLGPIQLRIDRIDAFSIKSLTLVPPQ